MDFEFSKENILPLPGGRNVHQLGIALQAQTNRECQMELLQQKEQWEELIRTYTGEDPLENYYKYITWIEQTYPKHGHEGNLVPLLEHCLNKFESERRYANDRRFCKLWIKYFDLQSHPLEFYHMLKAKGLCTGCADFYKAWAYYHEAAGDFQSANNVFEEGKRNLAQPFDELENAHQNLIMAAGQHMLFGPNETHLLEKRQALTSLHTYRPGRVSSVRVPSSNGIVTVPSNSSSTSRSNMVVQIHEDRAGEGAAAIAEAPPISIIAAVKRQEMPKENTLKAGPWSTTVPVKKRVIGSSGNLTSGFTVHEDVVEIVKGIQLPKNYPKTCQEDYSDWVVSICYPEPPNPACVPMYPKHRVYGEPNTEYSIEELRATRYRKKDVIELIDDDNEVEFVEEILPERTINQQSEMCQGPMQEQHISQQPPQQVHNVSQNFHQTAISPQSLLRNSFQKGRHSTIGNQQRHVRNLQTSLGGHQSRMGGVQPGMGNVQPMMGNMQSSVTNIQSPMGHFQSPLGHIQQPTGNLQSSMGNMQLPRGPLQSQLGNFQSPIGNVHSPIGNMHSPMRNVQPPMGNVQSPMGNMQSPMGNVQSPMGNVQSPMGNVQSPMGNVQSPMGNMQSPMGHVQSPMGSLQSPMGRPSMNNNRPFLELPDTSLNVWNSPQQKVVAPFGIFEQSLEENQPKGSAMKTSFKDLNAEELAETGSRGGMDIAVTAQGTDSAQRMAVFNESSSSSAEDLFAQDKQEEDYVNTDVFNFNLNSMKVSTPQKSNRNNVEINRDNVVLSTIMEESKSITSGSSSNSILNAKSSNFNKTNKMGTISEEHNSYLAQNLKANAELRYSLLGNLMDMSVPARREEERPFPVEMQAQVEPEPVAEPVRTIPPPANVAPLDFVPSDPFKSSLINQLLDRVVFPGPHKYGYKLIPFIPRLCVKKEPVYIGRERYVVEKQLGKGTFGTVYKAIDLGNCSPVAMKYQKPANKWEFYICRELQSRLANHPLRDRFMDIPLAYFGDQASLIISEYIPGGSLLDLANMSKQKSGKTMKECLVIYFCIQMLQIIQAMHQVRIIHADIKPDNFLVFVTAENTVGLQLIDFGCSIDMSLFPANASFRRPVTTEDFVCCEMLDGRPWNYHTDLFCIAATAHVLLFDTYIKMQNRDGLWSIQQRFPRYLKVDSWNMFFSSLLNQQTSPADAASIILMLEETLEILNKDSSSALPSQMRFIVNLLKNR